MEHSSADTPPETLLAQGAPASTETEHIRFGITAKLFIAVASVCLFLAIGIGIANRMSFDTGFLDYLGEQEQAKLTALADVLAEEYTQKSGWDFLRNDQRIWRRTVTRYTKQEQLNQKSLEPSDETERARRTWQVSHLRSSLGLMSKDRKELIAGTQPSQNSIWYPIQNEHEVIGWLTRDPLTVVTENIDLQFQENQSTTMWVIIGLSFLLTAGVSVFMARGFLAPVRHLANVTDLLAQGDLSARANIKSGDELGVLAQQFNQLAETLQKNETARRTFMAEISHDLRTPLAILRGELEALEDGVRPLTKQSLASLTTEVSMLTRLVNDIHALALADLGSLAYEKEPIDVTALLQEILNAAKERLLQKNISLKCNLTSPPLMLFADASRLTQVIQNLLENSLRYTSEGGTLQVLCRQEGEMAIIDVLDSAPGVPESALPSLFDRFRTGDSARNRQTSGSGLGLAICRSIIEAHNGSIRALPSPLGGIWIRISLPLLS